MTLALGIDPGTATTGYGFIRLLSNGDLEPVSFGVILTPKEENQSVRLEMLFDELNKLIKKYKPETAAVEKLFFSQNVSTGITVGQARGVILLSLQKAKVATYEYSPTEVKQAVAGYGHAEKKQMQEMVRALLQLEKIPKPDDAADALAIAITHLNTARYDLMSIR